MRNIKGYQKIMFFHKKFLKIYPKPMILKQLLANIYIYIYIYIAEMLTKFFINNIVEDDFDCVIIMRVPLTSF